MTLPAGRAVRDWYRDGVGEPPCQRYGEEVDEYPVGRYYLREFEGERDRTATRKPPR